MYLTIYTNTAPHQITWEEILNNPYLTLNALPKQAKKKLTTEITDEYAERLWNKRHQSYSYQVLTSAEEIIKDIITEEHYTHFEIPKKSNPNKKRPIDAPDELISGLQVIFKDYIEGSLQVLPHKAAHAYVTERSVVTAMETHKKNNSKWFLQIDLKDFFNSIKGEWLKDMLLEVYPFKFIPKNTLDSLIKISLLHGALPQGSRLSPTLTNICMVPIDHDITETLHNYKRHHYVYTRYADDITISCKEKFDPKKILNVIKSIFKKWNVPFRINHEKTRFGSTAGKNYHLGLIINKDNKISAGHEKNQKFRAMIFNFCTVGDEWDIKQIQHMLGMISYYKSFEPEFVKNTINKYNAKFNIDIMTKAKILISQ
jgi:hypothetical protein